MCGKISCNKEEEILRIKSHQIWLKGGDKNIEYFHKQTKTIMSFNYIKELKDNNNKKINGQDDIKKLALQHFNQLFSDSGETDPISQVDLLSSILPNIYDKENEDLENPISEHEIIESIWTLHPQVPRARQIYDQLLSSCLGHHQRRFKKNAKLN